MKKIKILFVQIMNRNFGDTVIAENTLFLLRKALWKRNRDFEILNYNIFTRDIGQVKYADAIIFAGGGIIKFEQEAFWELLHEIIFEAQKWKVPVFLNAVGVEGYSDNDYRCQMLKEALNLSCVKSISVRDDIDILKKCYITNSGIRVRPVFDPAIYSAYTYAVKRNIHSNMIGVGIARELLFSDYGHDKINRDYLVNFYKQLVKNIETSGYKWIIFTNGYIKDNEFAQEVLNEIGYGNPVITPRSDKELVSTIASFKGIIASRMHASIIAYALNIPSIGRVWNNKLMFWGKKTGYEDRYILPDDLSADRVSCVLSTALQQGCRKVTRWQQFGTYKEIAYFVRHYVKTRERYTDDIDYAQHVAAMALGGENYIYRNMNSLNTLPGLLSKGYCWIEIDIRLTADHELVCVNGWNKKTYGRLGIRPQGDQDNQPMLYADFKEAKYYGIFDTTDFNEFADAFWSQSKGEGGFQRLIIDIGKPKIDSFKLMICKLQDIFKNFSQDMMQRIYIRLQGTKYVKCMEKMNSELHIIYQLPDMSQDSIDFCTKHNITMVCLGREQCTDEMIQTLKRSGFEVCLFYCMEIGEISKYIRQGIKVVGSSYYDIDYMNRLTK